MYTGGSTYVEYRFIELFNKVFYKGTKNCEPHTSIIVKIRNVSLKFTISQTISI